MILSIFGVFETRPKVCREFHQGTQSVNTKNIFKLFKENGFVCDKEYSFDKQGVAYFYKP